MYTHLSYDEPELLSLSAQGEEQAFIRLLQMHKHKLYCFVLQITGSEKETESTIQNLFAGLWNHREQLVQVEDFDSHLFTVTLDKLLPAAKKQTHPDTGKTERLHHLVQQCFQNACTEEERAEFTKMLHQPAMAQALPDLLFPAWNRFAAGGFMPDEIWNRLTARLSEDEMAVLPEKSKGGGIFGWLKKHSPGDITY